MEILFDILLRTVGVWFICGYIAAIVVFLTELINRSDIWNIDFFYHTFIKFPLLGMIYLFRVFEALNEVITTRSKK